MVQYFATQIQSPDLLGAIGQAEKITAMRRRGQLEEFALKQAQEKARQEAALPGLRQRAIEGMPGAETQLFASSPESALQLYKLQEMQRQPLVAGSGLDVQAANNQALMYQRQGLGKAEAIRRGISDVYQTQMQTDELGNVITRQPLPNISPEEINSAQRITLEPPESKAQVYKEERQKLANMGVDISDIPEEYTQQLEIPLANLASQQPTAPSRVVTPKSDVLSGAARRKRVEEAAKIGATKQAEIASEALAASDQLENFQEVYDIYKGGFEGGLFSGLDFKKIEFKRALGLPLTPTEQQFASDYSRLKSIADINVAKSIKVIFGGNISDGERVFVIQLQAQPLNIAEQAIAKAAVQEAGALQKIRKNKMADEWVAKFGAFEAKDNQGRSFQSYYSNYAKQNPIMTPAFLAERGAVVPITGTTNEQKEVFRSLPIGAKFINPIDKKVYRKQSND